MATPGTTVAQAKAASPESLWHFLSQLPGTVEAQQLYALLIFGVIGMFAHYFVKWIQGEISGNLLDYLFRQEPRRTVLSLVALIGSSFTLVVSPVLMPNDVFIGWGAVLWMAVTTGYGIDSVANKGDRQIWTEQDRAEKAALANLSKQEPKV